MVKERLLVCMSGQNYYYFFVSSSSSSSLLNGVLWFAAVLRKWCVSIEMIILMHFYCVKIANHVYGDL